MEKCIDEDAFARLYEACQEKSNEIKATPRLIERASFELGCVVTADAKN